MGNPGTPAKVSLEHEWVIGSQLALGGFATVCRAKSARHPDAVAKFIPKEPGASRELLFGDLPDSPYVMPIMDRGETDDYWVLIMPRAEQSLQSFLAHYGGPPPLQVATAILEHLALAVAWMLEHNVVHRDLKPANILLWDGVWRIADFGIARYADASTAPHTRKFAFSPPYAAPEQWRRERCTNATDVYAFGVIAHELLAGARPFPGPTTDAYHHQHLHDAPPALPDMSPPMRSLVTTCLAKTQMGRPRADRIRGQLHSSTRPATPAVRSLQEANVKAVDAAATQSRRASQEQTNTHRLLQLADDGSQLLDKIRHELHKSIVTNAPAAEYRYDPPSHRWSLNLGAIEIDGARMCEPTSRRHLSEVASYSRISARLMNDAGGYAGRAHSLWYCNIDDPDVFRWYELAFMRKWPIPSHGVPETAPFDLRPDSDAVIEIAEGHGPGYQKARPIAPIDQDWQTGFIERWLAWFAQAANGTLARPVQLPEE